MSNKMRRLEELAMSAWPAIQTNLYDGWVLRFAEGYTKRTNSICPLYAENHHWDALQEKIAYCEEAYVRRDLPTVFKILSGDVFRSHQELDRELAALGYELIDKTSVRTLDMLSYQEAKRKSQVDKNLEDKESFQDKESDHACVQDEVLTDMWIDGYASCSGVDKMGKKEVMAKMLRNIVGQAVFVTRFIEDKPVAFGYGVIDEGYMGLYDIFVDEPYRGQGFGKEIMYSLLQYGMEHEVKVAYLQVVKGNSKAEALYDQLGFKEEYGCWYRRKRG